MKKIYIYEVEVLRKRIPFQDKVVNYVKLARPEGLEEHWPNVGDIVNLYTHGDIFYTRHKVIEKRKDDLYIIESTPVSWPCDINIKIDYLKEEGLEYLLKLPHDINDEIKGLSKLTRNDVNLDKSLNLYFEVNKRMSHIDGFYDVTKNYIIREIKDKIKDTDVWVDPYNFSKIELYTNEPAIEEAVDRMSVDGFMKFKGIIEKEIKIYRIYIRTNIYKKNYE